MTRKKKSSSAEASAEGDSAAAPKAPAAAEPKKPAVEPASTAAVGKAPDKPKAKPEAKAKTEAKAKAKPKAEVAQAAPKAKAEAKAAPKAKAEAKSEPKAKSEAKAKPEAKAKAKAEAKVAEPKAAAPKSASGKASAKPKAKGSVSTPAVVQTPVPPPAPAPTVVDSPTDGMEVVSSRKNRRRKKKAEEMPEEPEEAERPVEPSEEELKGCDLIKAQHDERNNAILKGFQQQLKELPDLANKHTDQVEKSVQEQQKALHSLLEKMSEKLEEAKIAKPKRANTGDLMKNLVELNHSRDDSISLETQAQWRSDIMEDLSKALAFDSFRTFQAEMTTLKEQVQAKLSANEAIVKMVKSGNAQRRIVERVAKQKGIKADELTEEEVKSINVELPPEVTFNLPLYKGRYEKQFGVIIDLPDGNSKGGGKGAPKIVKSLVVRGVESEAQRCVAALKALDLRKKEVLKVQPKQASAIMGVQQANARKLEEKHEGVFIDSQRDPVSKMTEITLYGPAKKVAACIKEVQDNHMAEDPAANSSNTAENVIRIDQDLAKPFIGKDGKNVKKLQAETGMTIQVDHRKEDDTPASIKIVGDQDKMHKARDEINSFLKTLSTCIVEGDEEVISRMWKGKGKGKGSNGGTSGNSRFAALYKNSGLTVLKKDKGIKLAGDKEEVTKWKAELEDCLKEEATVPISISLSVEQRTLWNQERLDSVKQSSGAARVQKGQRGAVIEVFGTDAEKEKAKASIDEINTKLSSTATIEEVPEKAARSLSGKGAARLKEVEGKFGVSVYLDHKSSVIKIQGAESSVGDAKKRIQQMITAPATREIEIEWEEGGVIIGKSGVMVNRIKDQSGAAVQINPKDQKKVVVLRGDKEQVLAAEKMVHEALQNARNSKASAEAPAGAEAPPAEKPNARKEKEEVEQPPAKEEQAEKRPAKSKGKGRSWQPESQPEFIYRADSFPLSLGSGEKGKKAGPQNSAWKKADEDENGEEAQDGNVEKIEEEANEEEAAEEEEEAQEAS